MIQDRKTESPEVKKEKPPQKANLFHYTILGAIYSVAGAFPVAGVVALLFRFPIPLGGYASGPEAIIPAMFAVFFYGLLGGFPLLAILGAIAGWLTWKQQKPDTKRIHVTLFIVAGIIDLIAVLILATLDWIIGPW